MCSNSKPREFCCFCTVPSHGVRLMPIFDLFELFVYGAYILVAYFGQETYILQISILIVINGFSCIVKLIGSLPMMTVGAPNPKTNKITIWPHRYYFLTRTFGLIINVIALSAQLGISSYAIWDN